MLTWNSSLVTKLASVNIPGDEFLNHLCRVRVVSVLPVYVLSNLLKCRSWKDINANFSQQKILFEANLLAS